MSAMELQRAVARGELTPEQAAEVLMDTPRHRRRIARMYAVSLLLLALAAAYIWFGSEPLP